MGWFKTPEEKQAAEARRLAKGLFKDNIDKVRAAIEAGADVNACGEHGHSALAYHASSRRIHILKLLLEKGADPNGKTNNNYTPLMAAASDNDVDTITLLLEKGAYINARSSDGRCALHHAAYWGRGNAIACLIAQGADNTLRDSRMNSAADIAIKENYPGIAALLRGDLDDKPADPVPDLPGGWQKTAEDEIARVSNKPQIGYRMTEIFNFRALHYTQISANMQSGAESQSLRGFDDFSDPSLLREAMGELLSRGGAVAPEVQARLAGKSSQKPGLSAAGAS